MPTLNIHFADDESLKIEHFAKFWKLSKYNVVKQMVRDFPTADIEEDSEENKSED